MLPRHRRHRRPPRQERRRPRPRRSGLARLLRVPCLGRFQPLPPPQPRPPRKRRYHPDRRAPRRSGHAQRDTRTGSARQRSRARGHRAANPADADSQFRRRAHHCRTRRCQPPAAVRQTARAATYEPPPSTSASQPSPPPAVSTSPTKVIASPVADRARATITPGTQPQSAARHRAGCPLPLPALSTACRKPSREVHQDVSRSPACPARHSSVRSPPSFRPDRRARHAGARSAGKGWPVFGPPRRRRQASLTAASTTAGSPRRGCGLPIQQTNHQKASAKDHQKMN